MRPGPRDYRLETGSTESRRCLTILFSTCNTAASSSSLRWSTSILLDRRQESDAPLSAALCSPAFMAVFMSSEIWLFKGHKALPPERQGRCDRNGGLVISKGAYAWILRLEKRASGGVSRLLLSCACVPGSASRKTHDDAVRSGHSSLFTGTLEATQGGVEILVFFYANTWHTNSGLPIRHK